MITKIVIILVASIEVFALKFWISCISFRDGFHFSAFDVKLKVEEQIHNDVGYGVELVRFFHNKIFVGSNELANRYFFFWDTHFQAVFFSLIGIFGIFCGFWYLATSKKRRVLKWVIICILLGLPFLEVLSVPLPFFVRLILLWLPYVILSLYGLWIFVKPNRIKRWLFITLLLGLSIWYVLTFQGDIFLSFCYNK